MGDRRVPPPADGERGRRRARPTVESLAAVEAAAADRKIAHAKGLVNAVLRRFLRERDALVAATDREPEARWNHPAWWIQRLRQDHPEHWQAILEAPDFVYLVEEPAALGELRRLDAYELADRGG